MSGDYDHDHHAPQPWGPHDWGHGAPHNSFSPLFMSMGIAIFLFGMAEAWSYGTYNPGNIPMILVGLLVVGFSLFIWWRQDLSFDGHYEPIATGVPFRGIQIRKVGVWVFLMSEMMVFTSLFSTYMRYRLGIENCGTYSNVECLTLLQIQLDGKKVLQLLASNQQAISLHLVGGILHQVQSTPSL